MRMMLFVVALLAIVSPTWAQPAKQNPPATSPGALPNPKKSNTAEKNPLPTKDAIAAEKAAQKK